MTSTVTQMNTKTSKQNIQLLETGGNNSILISLLGFGQGSNHFISLLRISFFFSLEHSEHIVLEMILGDVGTTWTGQMSPHQGILCLYWLELVNLTIKNKKATNMS